MAKKRFSLKVRFEEIELEMPSGEIREARIQEFDGLTRDKYTNIVSSKMIIDPVTKQGTGLKDHMNMFADLLSLCLHVKNNDGKFVLLTIPEIQAFPSAVQQELFEIASKINSLGAPTKEEEEERKND